MLLRNLAFCKMSLIQVDWKKMLAIWMAAASPVFIWSRRFSEYMDPQGLRYLCLSFKSIGFGNLVLWKFYSESKFSLVIQNNSFIESEPQNKHFKWGPNLLFSIDFHCNVFAFAFNALWGSHCDAFALFTMQSPFFAAWCFARKLA